ncbi:MAG: nucleotidyltransferase domain-containing protein [Spirochaetales bacterium]|nr:nucleotidyltransferase domain-containing protein [Spirochaetales bacterium]
MEKHHQDAIRVFLNRYAKDESILAILLAGSLAHGFAGADSDIDVSIIVTAEEFEQRKAADKLAFSIRDICTYEGGYVDCKVADPVMLEMIAEKGSDPARYAFKDNSILYAKIEGLEELLARITRFPAEQKDERRKRFASQMLAWRWYYGEGVKKQNRYIQYLALQKQVLFSARVVLNENEMLYPFHKWLLRELETAPKMPPDMLSGIDSLLTAPSVEKVNQYVQKIFDFIGFSDSSVDWPNYFLRDSEQNWILHEAPVDDI